MRKLITFFMSSMRCFFEHIFKFFVFVAFGGWGISQCLAIEKKFASLRQLRFSQAPLRSDKFNAQFYSSCSSWSWTSRELLLPIHRQRWGRADAAGSSRSSSGGTIPAHPDTVDAINNAFRKWLLHHFLQNSTKGYRHKVAWSQWPDPWEYQRTCPHREEDG